MEQTFDFAGDEVGVWSETFPGGGGVLLGWAVLDLLMNGWPSRLLGLNEDIVLPETNINKKKKS